MGKMENTKGWGRRSAVAAVAALTAVGCGVTSASGAVGPANSSTKQVIRIAGSIAIGTAIAASQENWVDNGQPENSSVRQAKAVVLTRSNEYYDALTGSDLAVDTQGPLLLTPTGGLDASVLAEIKRILPKSAPIYLLGGTAALSPAVSQALTAAGYTHQVRLAGSNEYGTAIAIDDELDKLAGGPTTTVPCHVIIVRGDTYYDALSAGAAAGYNSEFGGCPTVVVLSDGNTLPQISLNYLNAHYTTHTDPYAPAPGASSVYAVGGPGATAYTKALAAGELPFWKSSAYTPVVGADAPATALDVAKTFFSTSSGSPEYAAVATEATWQDALAGGAFVASHGGIGGPLLLTPPSGLYSGDASYLKASAQSNLSTAFVMGGPAALPDSIVSSVQAALNGG
jgi:hypothetical protein